MIRLSAHAKINLCLDIAGVREDGYHLLKTVMQEVSLSDTLFMEKAARGIELTCNRRYIPTDGKNVVCRVAAAFFESCGISGGVKITLKKRIPCGAGLGGGSSDGAAALDGLCRLYGVKMSLSDKIRLTQSIGADIPFFFYGGTALCEGIGEKVTPLPALPPCGLVIVKPGVSLSTAAIFASPLTKTGGDSAAGVVAAIKERNIEALCSRAQNALERASIALCPAIDKIKAELCENGARFSMMSGSGSAVFGIFENAAAAAGAVSALSGKYAEVYAVSPV